jgi:hypothetical protein
MKIQCPCGDLIIDTTDKLPYKAWLLADQDMFLLYEPCEDVQFHEVREHFMKAIYQCESRGRICLDDPVTRDLIWFRPETDPRKKAFGSIKSNLYPVVLVGSWKGTSGTLDWDRAGDDEGGFEDFQYWEALESRYLAMLDQLRKEDRLLRAHLYKDNRIVHEWKESDPSRFRFL